MYTKILRRMTGQIGGRYFQPSGRESMPTTRLPHCTSPELSPTSSYFSVLLVPYRSAATPKDTMNKTLVCQRANIDINARFQRCMPLFILVDHSACVTQEKSGGSRTCLGSGSTYKLKYFEMSKPRRI